MVPGFRELALRLLGYAQLVDELACAKETIRRLEREGQGEREMLRRTAQHWRRLYHDEVRKPPPTERPG